jgi:hypothetical protein
MGYRFDEDDDDSGFALRKETGPGEYQWAELTEIGVPLVYPTRERALARAVELTPPGKDPRVWGGFEAVWTHPGLPGDCGIPAD